MLDENLRARWEACLNDVGSRDIVSVWNDLKRVAYGERDPEGVFQEAYRGMQALIWHPAFPLCLCEDALSVGAHELPKTPHWKLNCFLDPRLEYNRRCTPGMGKMVWVKGKLRIALDPLNTQGTFDDEGNLVKARAP